MNIVTKANPKEKWHIDAEGILDSRYLPDSGFTALWDAVIIDESSKREILAQGILNFTLRPRVDRALLPLHGIILLVGPPGTGKTSLARGLASRIAEVVSGIGTFRYLEVEPHALTSSALGRSQKAVTELFGQTIAENADSPLIVLLDEIETLAANRSRMSLEANPVDVHRATDAVLAQLDYLAAKHPNLLFIATSNFPDAIDGAFLSRADLVRTIGLPTSQACYSILLSSIGALAVAFPQVAKLRDHEDLISAAKECEGLDGRQIRKIVVAACASRMEVTLDPNQLTAADVLTTARAVQSEQLFTREKK